MGKTVASSHGNIAVSTSKHPADGSLAIVFIHGNSSCKEVFADLLAGPLGDAFFCVAMDLPGHGHSDNATRPEITYNMPGYAACLLEVITALTTGPFVLVGWSLGGHIGIEMTAHTDRIKGLVISGTPPIGQDGAEMQNAFLPHEHMAFTGQETLTDLEAEQYAHTTCGTSRYEPFLYEAVRRTDGRARRLMMASAMKGEGVDQLNVVQTSSLPLAVINGQDEALVNNEYVKAIRYANLWQDKVHLIANAGHAPFWDQPQAFTRLLSQFVIELTG